MSKQKVNAILAQILQIRMELAEPITPRRKLDAVIKRINKRLDAIDLHVTEI